MKTIGVIPARYASSRFPGKPLADIHGRPMIDWVYRQAKKVPAFSEVYVATDSDKISAALAELGIPFVMTAEHRTAANRTHEVAQSIAADFYVTINGDEPLIDPAVIGAAIPDAVPQDIEFGTNIITAVVDAAQVMDPANIKVVFDDNMNALYMSRSPIPFPFNSIDFTYYKHVGVHGYNKKMLDFYSATTPGMFEKIEGIDTLRFIDYGKRLHFICCEGIRVLSVDTPKDLEYVREVFQLKISKGELRVEEL